MPIPKPFSGESEDNFITRCMGDPIMQSEYGGSEQRLAVCNDAYSSEAKEEVRSDVFTTESEAETRASEIGCEGIHSHDENGEVIYMPCASHSDYINATGADIDDEDDAVGLGKSEEISVALEVKELDLANNEGVFEGYGSVFNNTDLGNDVILQGAFAKSLRKTGAKGVKLLYQHKTDMPIGVFEEIREDDKGLHVKGRLALGTQAGREAYELMKMGAIDGLSIGFRVDSKGQSYDSRNRRRLLKEVELMEVSLVTFPMNPRAKIRSVKGEEITIREWESGLRDVFHLSRSEAKVAAKAVHDSFHGTTRGCECEETDETAKAIQNLINTLKGDS